MSRFNHLAGDRRKASHEAPIDALDALLRHWPFNPSDDRIVALDLHFGSDDQMGYEVGTEVW